MHVRYQSQTNKYKIPQQRSSKREILLKTTIKTKKGPKQVTALVDSGANLTLVSKDLVKKENLVKEERGQPVEVRNADGMLN